MDIPSFGKDRSFSSQIAGSARKEKKTVMAATLPLVIPYLCWCQETGMWEDRSFKSLAVNSKSVKGPDLTGFLLLMAVDALSKAQVSVL